MRFASIFVFLSLAFLPCRAATLPLLPHPKSVAEGAVREESSYKGFSLRTHFDKSSFDSVWSEIQALSREDGRGVLRVEIKHSPSIDGYKLSWKARKVEIIANDEDNAFWGLQSLKQLLRASYDKEIVIEDTPDMLNRVFMDDVSRGAIPNIEQMKRQLNLLSELKYSGYMLYIENVAKTESHPDVPPQDGCITMSDLDELCRYAKSYHIELIGCLQSLGHFEKTLALPQYRDLGETPNMINPRSEKAKKYLKDVISELALHSSSQLFCVCCDETFDLEGKENGKELYLEHLCYLRDVLRECGKTMMVFGDMFLKYPDMIDALPSDVLIISWNYDAPDTFEPWLKPFGKRELWIAPGVHSSNKMLPDLKASSGNRRFIEEAYEYNSRSCIVCTWDESAYHSVQHLNYGIAQFAECMWDVSRTSNSDDFERRYEKLFFGIENGACAVYEGMMQLAEIPMFFSMNDRVFYQRFTPEPKRPLVVDSEQLYKAQHILSPLSDAIQSAIDISMYNHSELEVWKYIIDCYHFILKSRLGFLKPENKDSLCVSLIEDVDSLKRQFSHWWRYENQEHSYKGGIQDFENKKLEIMRYKDNNKDSLVVLDRTSPYMCYWLSSLTLPNEDAPDFNPWPTPGLRYVVSGRDNKWTKTESLNALSMDANAHYDNPALYSRYWAYSALSCNEAKDLNLIIGYSGRAEIFLNGKQIFSGELSPSFEVDKYTIALKLEPGKNHLVIMIEKQFPECVFSAYLSDCHIHNSKYRYTIR